MFYYANYNLLYSFPFSYPVSMTKPNSSTCQFALWKSLTSWLFQTLFSVNYILLNQMNFMLFWHIEILCRSDKAK